MAPQTDTSSARLRLAPLTLLSPAFVSGANLNLNPAIIYRKSKKGCPKELGTYIQLPMQDIAHCSNCAKWHAEKHPAFLHFTSHLFAQTLARQMLLPCTESHSLGDQHA